MSYRVDSDDADFPDDGSKFHDPVMQIEYTVICTAEDASDGEYWVVYRNQNMKTWVMPASEFIRTYNPGRLEES